MTLTRRSLLAITTALAALPLARIAHAEGTATDTAAAPDPASIPDWGVGDANAKVVLTEYLSLTCPHCKRFHDTVYPQLKSEYLDTGKVRLVIKEVYFDKYGLWGAMLARCGGEMRYGGLIDMLYDKQTDWAGTDDPTVAVAQLKKLGLVAGIDEATSDACLKDQAVAQALVEHYQANIAKDFPNDSFQGTPSFLVNGVVNKDIYSNMSFDDLKKILDAELAK